MDDGGSGDEDGGPRNATFPEGSSTVAAIVPGGPRQAAPEGPQRVRDAVFGMDAHALSLRDGIMRLTGDRVDPETGTTPRGMEKSVRSHGEALGKLKLRSDLSVADTPDPAPAELKAMIAGVRQLIRLANDTAAKAQEGSLQIRTATQAAMESSVAIEKNAAAAGDAAPPPKPVEGQSEPTSVAAVVDEAVRQARSLSEQALQARANAAPGSPYFIGLTGLSDRVGQLAEAAKTAASKGNLRAVRNGLTVTINALRSYHRGNQTG
jgi:hypothetical protein